MHGRFIVALFLTAWSSSTALAEGSVARPFVGIDWRVMGLASHLSHGPGLQMGALLFEHLKVGIAGFSRPGPINPKEFEVELEGETYRGQSRLSLRSDGAVVGLLLAPRYELGRVALELPVTVGFGAFGFYLTGQDRNTPDGSRVSEWEDRLFDGKDSGAGLALDFGLRASIASRYRWLRVYFGAHYTTLVGYEATLADSYAGFSGVLGLEVIGGD